jgi:hypothetical protein
MDTAYFIDKYSQLLLLGTPMEVLTESLKIELKGKDLETEFILGKLKELQNSLLIEQKKSIYNNIRITTLFRHLREGILKQDFLRKKKYVFFNKPPSPGSVRFPSSETLYKVKFSDLVPHIGIFGAIVPEYQNFCSKQISLSDQASEFYKIPKTIFVSSEISKGVNERTETMEGPFYIKNSCSFNLKEIISQVTDLFYFDSEVVFSEAAASFMLSTAPEIVFEKISNEKIIKDDEKFEKWRLRDESFSVPDGTLINFERVEFEALSRFHLHQ